MATAACTSVDLAPLTTLRLGGPATRFVAATEPATVVETVATADRAREPLLVLAGGSNLVVADEGFDGTALHLATRGRQIDDGVLTAEAGEDWDALVAGTVAAGYGGLECLSGIPGSVGATPVQNVGAYGVELSELLRNVDVYDRRTGEVSTTPPAQLGLGYRTSRLKNTQSAVVLRIRLVLRTDGRSAPIRYAELARELDVEPGTRVTPARARDAVLALRRRKGMVLDPADHDTWSTGSFFVNPVLDEPALQAVLARAGPDAAVPRHPAGNGQTKLSAAWLIEHAGFGRGYPGPGGRVAVSGKHTLALTNRGGATTTQLLALAREIRDGVREHYGVVLQPEPVLVGCRM